MTVLARKLLDMQGHTCVESKRSQKFFKQFAVKIADLFSGDIYVKSEVRASSEIDGGKNERLIPIEGSPVDLTCMPAGCAFAARCDKAMKICLKQLPQEYWINDEHLASCWMNVKKVYDEAAKGGEA